MSLINQVLKDLERRHADGVESRSLARAVRPGPRRRSFRPLSVAVFLCLAGVAGAGAWWLWLSQPAAPLAATTPARAHPVGGGTAPMPAASGQPPPSSIAASPNPASIAGLAPGASGASSSPFPAAVPVPAATKDHADIPPAEPGASSPLAASSATSSENASAAPATATSSSRLALDASGARHEKTGMKTGRKAPRKPSTAAAAPAPVQSVAGSSEYPEPDAVHAEPKIQKLVRAPSDRERAESELRQGLIAVQSGNVPEAEDRLRQALAIDPLMDKARQALLGLYIQRDRRDDAERLLDQRLRLDSGHVGFAMALARLQLERGGNGEALVTLQRSAPVGESSADYQAMFANALARVGRHKEAAQRYQLAAQLAPQSSLWYLGLGMELKADNRPAEARAALERARDLGGLNSQLASYVDQQIKTLR